MKVTIFFLATFFLRAREELGLLLEKLNLVEKLINNVVEI